MDKFIEFIIFFSGTSIGGVLGYLLKTQIDHRLAIARSYETIRVTEFNKASATFRAAFVDAIYALRKAEKYGENAPGNILSEPIFAAHEKAKIMFEPFLSGTDLRGFNDAWESYRNYETHYCMGDSPVNPGTITTTKEMSKFCLDHLKNLLMYAEPKTST